MTVLLAATHILAFLAGGAAMRLLMVRYVRVREVDGHTAFEVTPGRPMTGDRAMDRPARGKTLAVVLLVAALVVIGIGVQAKLAADDNARRDRADRAYAECMTRFAADLVRSLDTRSRAGIRLDAADRRKSEALDQLLTLSNQAQAYVQKTGAQTQADLPPALVRRYREVLHERIAAQREYRRVYRDTLEVRRKNQYVSPRVVCNR